METTPKDILVYCDERNREPYTDWINTLKNKKDQQRIRSRVRRMVQGNFGDHEPVGEGVYELRLFFGSGYRIYFSKQGDSIVLLLCGGDKSSQQSDIKNAKSYWKEYQCYE